MRTRIRVALAGWASERASLQRSPATCCRRLQVASAICGSGVAGKDGMASSPGGRNNLNGRTLNGSTTPYLPQGVPEHLGHPGEGPDAGPGSAAPLFTAAILAQSQCSAVSCFWTLARPGQPSEPILFPRLRIRFADFLTYIGLD
ncbi:hypothetical protein HPB50_003376 [Hyalomma asiaticum]|uniref:Uncharacterized protein n=1 Tax=Hyalomma asiaticum TaxID=266040 RepID=A0ACB7TAG7_HYAAI|nr:hypothetical protein HPB50_003376 [Hyalomma asiaticum]